MYLLKYDFTVSTGAAQSRVFFSCTVNLQYMHDIVLVIWL